VNRAGGLELRRGQRVACGKARQPLLLGIVPGIVAPLLVGEQEATERDHRAGCRELDRASVVRFGGDPHRDGLPARVRHL
jgi:hypothetical protein